MSYKVIILEVLQKFQENCLNPKKRTSPQMFYFILKLKGTLGSNGLSLLQLGASLPKKRLDSRHSLILSGLDMKNESCVTVAY